MSERSIAMSLDYRPTARTEISIIYDDQSARTGNYLYRYTARQVKKYKTSELFPLTRQWMDEDTLFRLVILSGHRAFQLMFRTVLLLPHAYSNDCTVRAKPSGLGVCIAWDRLCHFRHAGLNVMVR